MTNGHEEILSAFVDEETSAFETRLSVKELITNDGQRSRWERYHLISDTMRGNIPPIIDKEFCNRIMQTIDGMAAEDVPEERMSMRSSDILKPVAGVALAASIAILTVFSVKTLIDQTPSLGSESVAKLPTQDQKVASNSNLKSGESTPSNPPEDARLNSYLVNHAEYASRRSMIPYARLVGYNTNQQ